MTKRSGSICAAPDCRLSWDEHLTKTGRLRKQFATGHAEFVLAPRVRQLRHEQLAPRRYNGDIKTVMRNGWQQLAANVPDTRSRMDIRGAWSAPVSRDADPLWDRLLNFMGRKVS